MARRIQIINTFDAGELPERITLYTNRAGDALFQLYDTTTGLPTVNECALLIRDPGTGAEPERLNGRVIPRPDTGVVIDPDGWKYLTFIVYGDNTQVAAQIKAAVAQIQAA